MAITATRQALQSPRRTAWWTGIALILFAVNLRAAVVGVAPLLGEIKLSEGLSGTTAGILTALPILCFGLLAPAVPRLAGRVGMERALVVALLLLCAGIAVRALDGRVALFAGTVLVGGAITIGNVLLPAMIKRDFADRAGLMTGLYTMAISAGAALAAGLTVPIARAGGMNWRGALAVWGGLAVLALFAWIPRALRAGLPGRGARSGKAVLSRQPLAWQVTGFMALQSLSYYSLASWVPQILASRGVDPAVAGLMLSIASLTGIAGALVAPVLATKTRKQSWAVLAITGTTALGVFGILVFPGLDVVTTAVMGFGQGAALALALTLIVLRSPDGATASQLSGMAQSLGYTFGATGPFLLGVVHDASGGWTVPLVVLLVLFVPQAVVGAVAGRDRQVEQGRSS
ncbi:MFS transporter [Amycolatopsis sp. NPDC005961]|uniref:CynX/NimT family MFS transporter n=1 Tax=Amycolatopsis sp. NPDC005961 TaxID=3156720 RepID=UPI0033D1E34B